MKKLKKNKLRGMNTLENNGSQATERGRGNNSVLDGANMSMIGQIGEEFYSTYLVAEMVVVTIKYND